MGPEGVDVATVDPQLGVRGVNGLRVADTHIMPKLTSGNTYVPAIATGERVAELITNEIPATA